MATKPPPKVGLVLETAARMRPILAGLAPDIQGAVLAELTATWLAGHRPAALRQVIANLHFAYVQALTEATFQEHTEGE